MMLKAQIESAISKANDRVKYEKVGDVYFCYVLDDDGNKIQNYDTFYAGNVQDFLLIYRPYYALKYLGFSDSLAHTLGLHTKKCVNWQEGIFEVIAELNIIFKN